MNTSKLIAELETEFVRITKLLEALRAFESCTKPVPALQRFDPPANLPKGKGKLSAAGLANIKAAQKARWAKAKKVKVTNGK